MTEREFLVAAQTKGLRNVGSEATARPVSVFLLPEHHSTRARTLKTPRTGGRGREALTGQGRPGHPRRRAGRACAGPCFAPAVGHERRVVYEAHGDAGIPPLADEEHSYSSVLDEGGCLEPELVEVGQAEGGATPLVLALMPSEPNFAFETVHLAKLSQKGRPPPSPSQCSAPPSRSTHSLTPSRAGTHPH